MGCDLRTFPLRPRVSPYVRMRGATRAWRSARRRRAATLLAAGLTLFTLLLVPAGAGAVAPSPELLTRATADPALATQLKRFEQRTRERGVDAGVGERRVVARDARGAARVLTQERAPTSGSVRTLALLVDFPFTESQVEPSWFDTFLFADVFGPQSVRGYYREISYGSPTTSGLLDLISPDLPSEVGWLRLTLPRSAYVSGGDHGLGSYPGNARRLVEDAVKLANPLVDFSAYDNNGDGFVDNLIVVHSGQGAELTGKSSDIWSHQWTTSKPVAVDGVYVSMYSMEPEYWRTPGDMTVGVYAHEIGHILGLPDLYDRDYSSAGVGRWSLMGSGSWNGNNGSSPARLDAWSSARLGWLQPAAVTGDPSERRFASVSDSRSESAVKLTPYWDTKGKEYFLIENRQQIGTDRGLPGSGLLIWHVDERRWDDGSWNDDDGWKLLDLEEADGRAGLDSFDGVSTPEQPFPGLLGIRTFNDATIPEARLNVGAPSGIAVDQISDSGLLMTARVGVVNPGDAVVPSVRVVGLDDGAYYRRDTLVTVRGSDEAGGSGVAGVAFSVDDGPTQEVAGASARVVLPVLPNGRHVLLVRATDRAGNQSAARRVTVYADSVGPVAAGARLTGTRGVPIRIKYRVRDGLSPLVRDVRIVIVRRSGAILKTIRLGTSLTRVSGKWYAVTWTPKERGVFQYRVTGRDLAGNPQKVTGLGRVTVR